MTVRSWTGRGLTRRTFLLAFLAAGATTAIAACASAPAAPTAAPAPQPTKAAGSAAAATSAPSAATATPAPAATAAPAEAAGVPTFTAPVAAAATALAAPAPQVSSYTGPKVSLEFWNPGTDPGSKLGFDTLVNTFNKQHPNVQVKNVPVPDTNHYAKYVTAIAGGQPPGAIATYDYSPIVSWAAQGFIESLDSYQKSMGIKQSNYFPVCWDMIHFHGHLWGFLQEFDFYMLSWNKSLFQAAGLDPSKPPKTIDDLDSMSAELIKKDSSGHLTQIGFCPWITAAPTLWAAVWGGSFFDPADEKWTINQDANVKMLDWHAKYAKMLGGPDQVTAFAKTFTGSQSAFYDPGQFVFYAGRMAMEGMGEWEPAGWIPDYAPKLVGHIGVANPPTAPGVAYGTGQTDGGNVYVLPKGEAHPDACMQFLTWVTGPKPIYFLDVGGNIPPIKSVAFSSSFAEQAPSMVPWIDLLKQGHMVPPATSPLLPYFEDQLNNAIQEVIYGRQTPKDALADLTKKIDNQLAQFKKAHPNW